MSEIIPLVLMWMLWQRGGGASPPAVPTWPTTSSPPPMPAFAPLPAHAATADTGTPLSDLHHAPPTPAPAHRTAPAHRAAAPSAATAAARATHTALHIPGAKLAALARSKETTHDVHVFDLQSILISRGAKLARDGLYGPKTAGAWSALAKKKGLPASITRVGPQVARVVTQTYDILSMPPIP